MKLTVLLLATLIMITTSLRAQEPTTAPTKSRTLIAYFSHSGNTREIAIQIKTATGADIFEIVPVEAYPANYEAVVEQAKKELAAEYRPPLKARLPEIGSYEVIFVGSPNWWGTIAPPVMTFLSSHDLKGKTVVPFITHEGSRLGKSVQDVKRLSPGATVLAGQAFWGRDANSAGNDIRKWISGMNLLQQDAKHGRE